MKEKLLKANKKWTISIADNKVKLSRPLQDETGYYAFTQHVVTTPSSDGKFVNVIGNKPTKLIMTEELDECIDRIKCDIKWVSIEKMLGITKCTCLLEKSTNIIGVDKNFISLHENLINQAKEHANNPMENSHSYLFCSHVAEQMETHETRSSQRRCPNDSHAMPMAHSLHLSRSTQCDQLEKPSFYNTA